MQGGSGSASDIKFQNIEMTNVTNPIIIDQNYCDKKKRPCQKAVSIKTLLVLWKQIDIYHYYSRMILHRVRRNPL